MSGEPEPVYIWMVGWERFQTFQKKRGKPWAPPWIKNSPELLDDPAYLDLSPETRCLLEGLWKLFARTRGRITKDTRRLSHQLNQRVTKRQLDSLNHAGWVEFCSGTVLEQRRNAFWNSSALEVEVEEKYSVLETNTVSSTAVAAITNSNGSAPAEPTAQTLTAEYVDACHTTGIQTPRRLIGQIAQATHQLLTEGVDPDAIRAGYRRMVTRGIVQPSLLPNFVAEASIPTDLRARANGGLTGDQITEIGRRMSQ